MTQRQLAELCGKITMNLMMGGVPMELAMVGVKGYLTESLNKHKELDQEARYDAVAENLKEEFSFCLKD